MIVTWNIRGTKGKRKRHILRNKIVKEHPNLIMLQETKCSEEELKTIGKKIWKNCAVVASDAIGEDGTLKRYVFQVLWPPILI